MARLAHVGSARLGGAPCRDNPDEHDHNAREEERAVALNSGRGPLRRLKRGVLLDRDSNRRLFAIRLSTLPT